MNQNVWKFPLCLAPYQQISIPSGARFLHCGMQGGEITLWAAVDPGAPSVSREIMIQGTGQELNPRIDDAVHLGTVMDEGYVWHVFEIEGG